jgi:thiol-disulfide isomerase/thioredoxin
MEIEITIDNYSKIKKNRSEKGYIALFYSHNCGHCVSFIPLWKKLKKNLSNQYQFIELENDNMQKLNKDYNISFSKVKYFPYICVYSPKKRDHIEFKDRRNENDLTKFIESNLSTSQSTELTYDNISSKLEHSNNKSYLLLVHWNKCHYCISFMPMWEQLKEENPKFQFFELERTELDKINEKGEISFLKDVRSFPTLIGYNSDNNTFNTYRDERNIKNLNNFIKELN